MFRANLYLNSDILRYKPSAGDLAYPEKLVMMESIAISLQEPPVFRRSDSQGSIASVTSASAEVAEQQQQQQRGRSGSEWPIVLVKWENYTNFPPRLHR